MKLPAFQFYPGDWRKDPNLCRCSHAAKGVWIDMICLMHETEERGVLSTNGIPWTEDDIVLAVGGDSSVTRAAIQELTLKGVVNRGVDGAFFCRRIVRDEKKRIICKEAGKLGGNPNLVPTLKGGVKGGAKGGVNPSANPKPTPSSSSSSSILLPEPQKAGFQESTLTPNGSAVAPATPSQEKGSDLLENEETGGNTLFSQFDGLRDTFPALAETGAFPAKETANAGHAEDSSKAKRKKHERNALLDALVVLDGTVLEFATGPAWSRAAAALKIIREVSPNVTASEIEAAARAYKRKLPDALCSSSALAKWWGSLQVPEPKSAYPSYSIGAPLTPEQKAEEEARANAMRQFLKANSTTT